jgi:hypothetical protein
MRLTPREQEKLLIFVAAEVARRSSRRKGGDTPFGWRGYRRRRMASTALPNAANFSV